jgi:hypothetical protein
VNLEELARVAHSMGEVVGLGLRNLAHCPVELNLMPESTRKWRDFNEKKPYLIATVFTMVAVVAATGLLFSQLASLKADRLKKIQGPLTQIQAKNNEYNQANSQLGDATNQLAQLSTLVNDRYYWVDTLPELRKVIMKVEETTSNKWHSAAGIWIERFVTPAPPEAAPAEGYGSGMPSLTSAMESDIETKYGFAVPQDANAAATAPVPGAGVSTMLMVCRARKGSDASANSEMMYSFLDALKADPAFDPKGTLVGGKMGDDDSPYTFTFAVKVALARPLKF